MSRENYKKELENLLEENFQIKKEDLKYINSSEGLIATDGDHTFKAITFLQERNELIKKGLKYADLPDERADTHLSLIDTRQTILHSYFLLKSLSESVKEYEPTKLLNFDVFLTENTVVLKSPCVNVSDYNGNRKDEMISLLRELNRMKWVCIDICPKNLKITKSNELLLIDIGYFFVPYYKDLFDTMCRRAYITMKFANNDDIKNLLRKSNENETFSYLKNSKKHRKEYDDFHSKIIEGV